jgi:hypothetical protein
VLPHFDNNFNKIKIIFFSTSTCTPFVLSLAEINNGPPSPGSCHQIEQRLATDRLTLAPITQGESLLATTASWRQSALAKHADAAAPSARKSSPN